VLEGVQRMTMCQEEWLVIECQQGRMLHSSWEEQDDMWRRGSRMMDVRGAGWCVVSGSGMM
jgi:hypothetical protein